MPFGSHYSYNKQLGKITVFKSLALSKITHLAFAKTIPLSIIDQLNKTQKNFFWNGFNPKIKNSTINNNYENGGLKNVIIAAKISSLQSSWIKRLFDESFHNWKILPLHIIHKSLGKNTLPQ